MSKYIDQAFWRKALQKPDWYLVLAEDFKRLEDLSKKNEARGTHKQIKREAYELVEEAVVNGIIPLAQTGDNFDRERKPIDTIVIHHTKNQPGMSLQKLNAVQLLRIYGGHYANPIKASEKYLRGQPVWSGHFFNGQQVFWGYHWLVRESGVAEHILPDNQIGWHAGNWDVNTRSVGICIDDDLSDKAPSKAALTALVTLIKTNYGKVPIYNIVGHCDVNKKTKCPGRLFASVWRQKIIEQLS